MRQTELLISLKNLKNNLQIIKSKTSSDIQAVIKEMPEVLGLDLKNKRDLRKYNLSLIHI